MAGVELVRISGVVFDASHAFTSLLWCGVNSADESLLKALSPLESPPCAGFLVSTICLLGFIVQALNLIMRCICFASNRFPVRDSSPWLLQLQGDFAQ
jgi:hypothetical protein